MADHHETLELDPAGGGSDPPLRVTRRPKRILTKSHTAATFTLPDGVTYRIGNSLYSYDTMLVLAWYVDTKG